MTAIKYNLLRFKLAYCPPTVRHVRIIRSRRRFCEYPEFPFEVIHEFLYAFCANYSSLHASVSHRALLSGEANNSPQHQPSSVSPPSSLSPPLSWLSPRHSGSPCPLHLSSQPFASRPLLLRHLPPLATLSSYPSLDLSALLSTKTVRLRRLQKTPLQDRHSRPQVHSPSDRIRYIFCARLDLTESDTRSLYP
jgi:hypothetical protein